MILDLPAELLEQVVRAVTCQRDLGALSRTNWHLSRIVAPHLYGFKTKPVSLQRVVDRHSCDIREEISGASAAMVDEAQGDQEADDICKEDILCWAIQNRRLETVQRALAVASQATQTTASFIMSILEFDEEISPVILGSEVGRARVRKHNIHWVLAVQYGKTRSLGYMLGLAHEGVESMRWVDQTLLHIAAEHERLEIAEILLSYGADLEARTRRGLGVHNTSTLGRTPLAVAVSRDRPRMIELLLDRGADTSVITDNGETLMDLVGQNDPYAMWRLSRHSETRRLVEEAMR